MIYFTTLTKYSTDLNFGLMRVLRPTIQAIGYETIVLVNEIDHPDNTGVELTDESALVIPEGYRVTVHPEATGRSYLDTLTVMANDGVITQTDVDEAEAFINDNLGESVLVTDLLPLALHAYFKTEQEMIDDGWFPAEPGPSAVQSRIRQYRERLRNGT
jgi:hypothetical protein